MKDMSNWTEDQLRAELARVKDVKRWLWVGIVACITVLYSIYSFAGHYDTIAHSNVCPCRPGTDCWPSCAASTYQIYDIGVAVSGMSSFPFKGEVFVSDSTVHMTFGGNTASYQVTSKANGNFYLTDGTMTNTMFIAEWPGRTNGFKHTLMITMVMDPRLGSGKAIYYCNKRN